MVVCKFFLQGNCRHGDNCRFEHPQPRNTGSYGNQNRFAPLSNRVGSEGTARKDIGWNISIADVRSDLTDGKGRPKWILSTYGPGRNAPASLLEGNEYSPEEIRLRFYEQASKGNEVQADQEAIQLWTNCEQAIKAIANNADNVMNFMELSEKKHPSRYDLCKIDGKIPVEQAMQASQPSNPPAGPSSSNFGAGTGFGQAPVASNPFSRPAASTFGQPASISGFVSSGFGQTSQPAGSGSSGAFGQPTFGSTGFGQATSLGQPAAPASGFGQISQPNSTFGQPAQASGFGSVGFGQAATAKNPFAPASAASGFGQTTARNPFAAPSAASGFGQAQGTSTFGQPTAPTSTFGQSTSSTSPFGQAAASTGTFGQAQPSSGFGQAQGTSSFGQATPQTSTFGQIQQNSSLGQVQGGSTFGQPIQPTSTFSQPAQANNTDTVQNPQPSSAFGQPPAFGQGGAFGKPAFGQSATATFGQPTQPSGSAFGQVTSGGFGGTAAPAFGNATGASNPFGQPPEAGPSNPFGVKPDASSGFGQPAQSASSFGQPTQQPSAPSNPLANSSATAPIGTSSTLLARRASTATPGEAHPLTPKPTYPLHYTETLSDTLSKMDISKKLTSYRGRRVQYINNNPCYERPDHKGWERIWFPSGGESADIIALQNVEKLNEIQGKEGEYTDAVKGEYKFLFEEGRFREGKMPVVPPMREWCSYDF